MGTYGVYTEYNLAFGRPCPMSLQRFLPFWPFDWLTHSRAKVSWPSNNFQGTFDLEKSGLETFIYAGKCTLAGIPHTVCEYRKRV